MLTCPQPDTAPNSTSLEQFFVLRKSAPAASGCLAVSFSQTSKAPREEDGCSAVPSFNSDGLYFTPAFILPCDQSKCHQNVSLYQSMHTRKANDYAEEKAEMWVPKPSRSNSFCCVCKASFQDYLTHLTSPKHQNLMKGSQYCHDIKELCGRFKGPQTAIKPRKARATKTKKINKVTVLRSCGSGRETSAEDSPKTAEPLIRQ